MGFGAAMLAVYALGAIALAMALWALRRRLTLSLAKHRSLTGHVRMARRIAALVPFYEYDEAHIFRCDDPPDEIATRRPAAFMRLADLYGTRLARTVARTREIAAGGYAPQFTHAYRVPVHFSRFLRPHLTAC